MEKEVAVRDVEMTYYQNPQILQPVTENNKIYTWILQLSNPTTRGYALSELSTIHENIPDLGPLLWYSFGTSALLLMEVTNVYPYLYSGTLTAYQSNRVCNVLTLMQSIASHPDTKSNFLQAHIPLFLYPFLHCVNKSKPFEYLRLTSLGVLGALVKVNDEEVINFLINSEVVPLCLKIMDSDSELNRILATYIFHKILSSDSGLSYICETYDRFIHVVIVLGQMIISLISHPSARLMKHIIICYLRLCDDPRALLALPRYLPNQLFNNTLLCLQEDTAIKQMFQQFVSNLNNGLQENVNM